MWFLLRGGGSPYQNTEICWTKGGRFRARTSRGINTQSHIRSGAVYRQQESSETFGLKSGFIFTPVNQPDCSRWPSSWCWRSADVTETEPESLVSAEFSQSWPEWMIQGQNRFAAGEHVIKHENLSDVIEGHISHEVISLLDVFMFRHVPRSLSSFSVSWKYRE